MSINRAVIGGNLVRDAELKATSGGGTVCHFTVAVNDRAKDKSGEWADVVSYFDCTLFGSRAERLAQWLTRGRGVTVDGRLRQRRWEAQDGTKRSAIEVLVDNVDLGSRVAQGEGPRRPAQSGQGEFFDADIPF